MNSECLLCQMRSVARHLKKVHIEEEERMTLIQSFLEYLAGVPLEISNPEVAAELNRRISTYHQDGQLYASEKKEYNSLLLNYYDDFRDICMRSDDPLLTAIKISIAGNIIDFGPDHSFSVEDTIRQVLRMPLAIDDTEELKTEMKTAQSILYLGDNAGEIVTDKLLLEQMQHPGTTFAVRGAPVLNDITLDDANSVGIDAYAKPISNGTDIPSTVLKHCSQEFIEAYNHADLIISKGQGNLEGLLNEKGKNIYYIFTVKCDAIARLTNTQKGNFVVMHARRLPQSSDKPLL